MTFRDLPPGIQQLNRRLNEIRTEQALANDVELARFLRVSDKTISFMRNGRLNKVALVAVAVFTSDFSILPPEAA